MTAMHFSPSSAGRPVRAALALLIGLTICGAAAGTAGATELKPPASKSKLLRDNDITIVIIDENDRRARSRSDAPARSSRSELQPPSSRVSRDEDEFRIRVKRDRSGNSGTDARSGPKVIIVDQNSRGCDGGGVCVIRP